MNRRDVLRHGSLVLLLLLCRSMPRLMRFLRCETRLQCLLMKLLLFFLHFRERSSDQLPVHRFIS